MRLLFVILVAAAVAAWVFREPLGVSRLTGLTGFTGFTRSADPASAAADSGARKGVRNGQVTYTNEPCPAGSREQALSGGTLTVLKVAPAVSPAVSASQPSAPQSPAAKALPNVRGLLPDPNAANMKDQRMEAIIGR